MDIEITDRKNFGTNRKPQLAVKIVEDITGVREFWDCNGNHFRVKRVEDGWIYVKRMNGPQVFPGKGPYTADGQS